MLATFAGDNPASEFLETLKGLDTKFDPIIITFQRNIY